ncbi:MAG: arsenic efflux protein [Clostridia bacterium]|nr:arsenic efflux protein [Clostridia bacterium]
MHEILHIIGHSIIDSIKLIPFLFITYLLMEYLEHHSKDIAEKILKKSGQFGALIGSALGLIPQCGFSSAAAGFYSARVISLGTLVAVFLSTSDEMLPILISNKAAPSLIFKILLIKFIIALVCGALIDIILKLIYKKKSINQEIKIEEFCEREDCHCHHGIIKPAIVHTLKVGGFILLVTLMLNLLIHFIGEENIASIILNKPILANILSAIVGMIPNCASSVMVTELFTAGVLSSGAMLSGLLINSGVALAVLFRTNSPKKNTLKIMLLLLIISIASGIIIDLTPIGQWLVN